MNRARILVAVVSLGGVVLVRPASAGVSACLEVGKTVSTDGTCSNDCAVAVEGAQVNYCYTITNCGNVTATILSGDDDPLGTIFPPPSELGWGVSSTTILSNPILTNTTNVITVSADFEGQVVSESAKASVFVVPPLTLEKTVITDTACTSGNALNGSSVITVTDGTEVTYCYKVTNPASNNPVTYTTHTLVDDVIGTIAIGQPCILGPGGMCVVSATTTINGPTKNTATWTAVATDTALCFVTQTVTNTAMAMAMVNLPEGTPTPTSTPTMTPTNTPGMEGAPCAETTDCEAGLECVDNVCSPNVAPAPAASHTGLLVILGLLLMVGGLGLLRMRRSG